MRRQFKLSLQDKVSIVAFLLFLSVVAASIISITLTRSSLSDFRQSVFSNVSTSNDTALSSAMVAFMLTRYIHGEDVEDQLLIRIDVLNTQMNIAKTKFPDAPGNFTAESMENWSIAKEGLELVIAGSRDPELID